MAGWKDFEKDCYNYLNDKYGHICDFIPLGQSDSTISDIKVVTKHHGTFYIEAKENLAQCGQFVLLPDDEKREFSYSLQNKSSLNKYSTMIIKHMEENYDAFSNAGTRGCNIDLPDTVFYGWIKNYYASKMVSFFITKAYDFIIFPIEHFENYFSVSAKYRIKKSGSSDPGQSNIPEIKSILNKEGTDYQINTKDGKTFVETDKNLAGRKLKGIKYTYLFNKLKTGVYNVRKLSNTKNANVIFTIELKAKQDKNDLIKFENSIS